jgi:hypothetical protein
MESRITAEIDASAFKNVLAEHQANFRDFLRAQEIIKKYIETHDCILYGGTAIDYALRLRGDSIYAESDLPDFDFWSPTHIETAREIIDILSAQMPGVKVYGTRAMFVRTMRVSVGDNGWVADISYVPREIFDKTPVLVFNGMRVVHPHFQFGDLHASLVYPYDNAPREVVFSRWKKDIARFNKLFTAYPFDIDPSPSRILTKQTALSREIVSHSLLHGFAAYSLYYNALAPDDPAIPQARAPVIERDTLLVDVPYDTIEIVAHRDVIRAHSLAKNPRRFYPLLDLLEASTVANVGSATLIAFTSYGRLANYNSFTLDNGAKVRAVSIHGLLKYFIACYLRAKYFAHTIVLPVIPAHVYLTYYLACIALISRARGTSSEYLFEPTLTVFGESSVPLYDLISLHADITRIIGADGKLARDIILPPKNIRATSSQSEKPVPFAYDTCEFLRISGEESLVD